MIIQPVMARDLEQAAFRYLIIFIAGTDPIDLGLVTNFRRPTGNVSGTPVFLGCADSPWRPFALCNRGPNLLALWSAPLIVDSFRRRF
jgi:hypothetical protein